MTILLAAVLLAQSATAIQEVPYRVLQLQKSESRGEPDEGVGCGISIARSVGVEGLKRVVCAAICRENLDRYRSITLMVFLGLNHLSDAPIDPKISRDIKYVIGFYDSDLRIHGKTGRLAGVYDELVLALQQTIAWQLIGPIRTYYPID